MKAEDKDLAVLETSKAQEKAVKREVAALKAGGIQKQPYLLGERGASAAQSCCLQVLCSLPRLCSSRHFAPQSFILASSQLSSTYAPGALMSFLWP